ncbi:Hypothetical predicted protein [Cloeon dipterum]|uniref:Uncharacterized protein n=1 Tax=Cloeon dipterum TaxID=197152 RepID=A0A8S1D5K0_9INSE|nr:Hypothetical predicted protein [Cloeon dipterum]
MADTRRVLATLPWVPIRNNAELNLENSAVFKYVGGAGKDEQLEIFKSFNQWFPFYIPMEHHRMNVREMVKNSPDGQYWAVAIHFLISSKGCNQDEWKTFQEHLDGRSGGKSSKDTLCTAPYISDSVLPFMFGTPPHCQSASEFLIDDWAHCNNKLVFSDRLKGFLAKDEFFIRAVSYLIRIEGIPSVLRIRKEEHGIIGTMMSITAYKQINDVANLAKRRLCELTGIHPSKLLRYNYGNIYDMESDDDISVTILEDSDRSATIKMFKQIEDTLGKSIGELSGDCPNYTDDPYKIAEKFEMRIKALVLERIKIHRIEFLKSNKNSPGINDWQFAQYLLPCFVASLLELINHTNDDAPVDSQKVKECDVIALENIYLDLHVKRRYSSPILLQAFFRSTINDFYRAVSNDKSFKRHFEKCLQLTSLLKALTNSSNECLPSALLSSQTNHHFDSLTFDFFLKFGEALRKSSLKLMCYEPPDHSVKIADMNDLIKVLFHVSFHPDQIIDVAHPELPTSSNVLLALVKHCLHREPKDDNLTHTHHLKKFKISDLSPKRLLEIAKEEIKNLNESQIQSLAFYLTMRFIRKVEIMADTRRVLATLPWVPIRNNPELYLENSAVFKYVGGAGKDEQLEIFKSFNQWFPFYIPLEHHSMNVREMAKNSPDGQYWAVAIHFLISSKCCNQDEWKTFQEHLDCRSGGKGSKDTLCTAPYISDSVLPVLLTGSLPHCQSALEFLIDLWVVVQLPFQPALFHQWLVAFAVEVFKISMELSEVYYLLDSVESPLKRQNLLFFEKFAWEFVSQGFHFLQAFATPENQSDFPDLNFACDAMKHWLTNDKGIKKIRAYKKLVTAHHVQHAPSKKNYNLPDDLQNIYNLNFWRDKSPCRKIFYDPEKQYSVPLEVVENDDFVFEIDELLESLQAHCNNKLVFSDRLKGFLAKDEFFIRAVSDLIRIEGISSRLRIRKEEHGIIGTMMSITAYKQINDVANLAKRRLCELTGIHPSKLLRYNYDNISDTELDDDISLNTVLEDSDRSATIEMFNQVEDVLGKSIGELSGDCPNYTEDPYKIVEKFEMRIKALVLDRIKIHRNKNLELNKNYLGINDWQFAQYLLPCFVASLLELFNYTNDDAPVKEWYVNFVHELISAYERRNDALTNSSNECLPSALLSSQTNHHFDSLTFDFFLKFEEALRTSYLKLQHTRPSFHSIKIVDMNDLIKVLFHVSFHPDQIIDVAHPELPTSSNILLALQQRHCAVLLIAEEIMADTRRVLATLPWVPIRNNPELYLENSAVFKYVEGAGKVEQLEIFKSFNQWFPFYIPMEHHRMNVREMVKNSPDGQYWAVAIHFLISSKGCNQDEWKTFQEHLDGRSGGKSSKDTLCTAPYISDSVLPVLLTGSPPHCQNASEFLTDLWVVVQLPFQPALFHQWLVAFAVEVFKISMELSEVYYLLDSVESPLKRQNLLFFEKFAWEFASQGFHFLQAFATPENQSDFPDLNFACDAIQDWFTKNKGIKKIRAYKKLVTAHRVQLAPSKKNYNFPDELQNIYNLNFWRDKSPCRKIFYDPEKQYSVPLEVVENDDFVFEIDELLESLQAHCNNKLVFSDRLKGFLAKDEFFIRAVSDLIRIEGISSRLRIRKEEHGIIGTMMSITAYKQINDVANLAKRRLCELTGIHPSKLLRYNYGNISDTELDDDISLNTVLEDSDRSATIEMFKQVEDVLGKSIGELSGDCPNYTENPYKIAEKFEMRIKALVLDRIRIHRNENLESNKNNLGINDWQFAQYLLPCFVASLLELLNHTNGDAPVKEWR